MVQRCDVVRIFPAYSKPKTHETLLTANIEHIHFLTNQQKKAHHIFQFGSSVCCSLVGVRWQETQNSFHSKLLLVFTYTRKMCREVEIYL